MADLLRIVVADDDAVFAALVKLKLEADGHQVKLAFDGDEALRLVDTEPPDLLILDVSMPGADGLEVTRRLRRDPRTANLPVVLLTGLDGDRDIEAGLQSGADYYITKPFVIDQLRYFIKSLLDDLDVDEPWDDSVGQAS